MVTIEGEYRKDERTCDWRRKKHGPAGRMTEDVATLSQALALVKAAWKSNK